MRPNRYHREEGEAPFFEGWYYKINGEDGESAFFFIYGVIFDEDERGEAFLHFGGGPDGETWYLPFAADAFHASRDHCEVYIETVENMASETRISGSVTSEGQSIRWELDLDPSCSWDETMGWLTNHEGLAVNWHVPTLIGCASGFVAIGDRRFEFDEAIAYSDHNWGPAFPDYWMWLQGADFQEPNTAIALSGGSIAGFGVPIEAFQVGYLRDGTFHSFRTQDSGEITGSYNGSEWVVDALQGSERVTVRATTDPAAIMELRIPTGAGMVPGAFESLVGTIAVTLWEANGDGWTEVDTRVTTNAGVEIGGTWPPSS